VARIRHQTDFPTLELNDVDLASADATKLPLYISGVPPFDPVAAPAS
jgi:hypothetical protein